MGLSLLLTICFQRLLKTPGPDFNEGNVFLFFYIMTTVSHLTTLMTINPHRKSGLRQIEALILKEITINFVKDIIVGVVIC